MFLAAMNGEAVQIGTILRKGVDPNAKLAKAYGTSTPLDKAIASGNVEANRGHAIPGCQIYWRDQVDAHGEFALPLIPSLAFRDSECKLVKSGTTFIHYAERKREQPVRPCRAGCLAILLRSEITSASVKANAVSSWRNPSAFDEDNP
ncbi:hypothetical protein ACFFSY_20915 [Paenibacillus aurantiacus]|uniref:Ankyrin repeat domain-containing protein n=1 Tax=Paenibacillus aurantiacus TaxID=1936118 RepID=A0ABV5KT39_9BACL